MSLNSIKNFYVVIDGDSALVGIFTSKVRAAQHALPEHVVHSVSVELLDSYIHPADYVAPSSAMFLYAADLGEPLENEDDYLEDDEDLYGTEEEREKSYAVHSQWVQEAKTEARSLAQIMPEPTFEQYQVSSDLDHSYDVAAAIKYIESAYANHDTKVLAALKEGLGVVDDDLPDEFAPAAPDTSYTPPLPVAEVPAYTEGSASTPGSTTAKVERFSQFS